RGGYRASAAISGCSPPPPLVECAPLLVRGGAVWQLVGLITRRSQVQILPPLPHLTQPAALAAASSRTLRFTATLATRWGRSPALALPRRRGTFPPNIAKSNARACMIERGLRRPRLPAPRRSRRDNAALGSIRMMRAVSLSSWIG